MKSQINQLMTKEMTRKEFLQHVGAGALIVLGISGLLSALLKTQKKEQVGMGYGSNVYGGRKSSLL